MSTAETGTPKWNRSEIFLIDLTSHLENVVRNSSILANLLIKQQNKCWSILLRIFPNYMQRNIWKCTNSTDKTANKPLVVVNQIQTLPPRKSTTIRFFFPQPGFTSKWHHVELNLVTAQVWEGKLWAGSLCSNALQATSFTAINQVFFSSQSIILTS